MRNSQVVVPPLKGCKQDEWTIAALKVFEEEVREHYLQKKIRAPIHLSGGNEQQVITIFKGVKRDDYVFSTYRSHYHALLKGIPRELVMSEILAGHSIHLQFPQYRFYTSALVGGCLPIALGTALGIKRRGGNEKVYIFIGDMAGHSGGFHECVLYAQGFNLPLIVVVECNGLSTNTPTHKVWGMPHPHITVGGTVKQNYLGGWTEGGVISYCYDREFPHYGVGVFVSFDDVPQPLVQERSDVMG